MSRELEQTVCSLSCDTTKQQNEMGVIKVELSATGTKLADYKNTRRPDE